MSGVPNIADMSGTYDTSGVNPGMNDQLAHIHNEIFETNPKTQNEILAAEAALQAKVEADRKARREAEAAEHMARIGGLKDIPFVAGAQFKVDVEELKRRAADVEPQTLPYAPTNVSEPVVAVEPVVAEPVAEVVSEEAATAGEDEAPAKKTVRKRTKKTTVTEQSE